jgi:transposase
MIRVRLSEAQREELTRVSRQAAGRVALRAQMVLLSGRGYSVPQIASIHDCGQDVVRGWLHRYGERGVAGPEDEPGGGRPPKDPLAGNIVDAQASQSPRNSGLAQGCWTVTLLATFLATRFGLVLSCASVRRYLHKLGWRWRRPRLDTARKPDPEAVRKLAALGRARELASEGLAHLLYFDECDLHLMPVIRSMWMKGERVRVPTPGKNRRHAFFGALDAATGQWFWAGHDRKLAVHFVAFLKAVIEAYPVGVLYLVLDSAPTHTAKVVQKWLSANPRVHVLWLPKYSAHKHNPVERVWGLMKDEVAANRLAGGIDELVGYARRFFTNLTPRATLQEAA